MRKYWTKKEEDELRDLYATHSAKDLAIRYGVSPKAISLKCEKLGIKKREYFEEIHLTDEQKIWLKLNFPHMATILCSMRLGISHRSVIRIARRMGLRKTETFRLECQKHAAKKAKESHLKNGTYPQKGYYSPNLQKGKPYQFKPGHTYVKPPF